MVEGLLVHGVQENWKEAAGPRLQGVQVIA